MKLDGIWRGSASYPGKPSCSGVKKCVNAIKPRRIGNPEAVQGQRVADLPVVLMTRGL